jgi:hypothetical protein
MGNVADQSFVTKGDKYIRGVLWASAVFNLAGALLFAFPESAMSQLAGLPVPVPPFYAGLLAEFILLFGGSYAWLAIQPAINRPLLAFGAIGKTCAFLLVAVLWLAGQAPARGVLAITGDLIFACLFFGWLYWPRNEPAR